MTYLYKSNNQVFIQNCHTIARNVYIVTKEITL